MFLEKSKLSETSACFKSNSSSSFEIFSELKRERKCSIELWELKRHKQIDLYSKVERKMKAQMKKNSFQTHQDIIRFQKCLQILEGCQKHKHQRKSALKIKNKPNRSVIRSLKAKSILQREETQKQKEFDGIPLLKKVHSHQIKTHSQSVCQNSKKINRQSTQCSQFLLKIEKKRIKSPCVSKLKKTIISHPSKFLDKFKKKNRHIMQKCLQNFGNMQEQVKCLEYYRKSRMETIFTQDYNRLNMLG